MTTFNLSQYQALTSELKSGVNKLSQKKEELVPTAQKAGDAWYMPQKIADALMWIAEKLRELAKWVIDKIEDALKAAAAPIALYKISSEWVDRIQTPASAVQGQTDWKALQAPRRWKGDAATLYLDSVRGQSSAAGRIGSIADQVSLSCTICASTGLVFYAALGALLAKAVIGTVAAIGALMTGVGAPAAALVFADAAGFTAAGVGAAVMAALAALGTQVEELNRIKGQAKSAQDFPGPPIGHWPKGTA
ncbi:hypothetical protein ACWCO0_07600 [Streptomyces tubercidicus]|uniref:ESX-1 secretion-associated protein EspA/EspE-like domain-containing protein n=1 Tax=Streptomyces tubercidicus TaxID=47759 RepID=A0A640UNN1_9ACTN|nr:hypothetical protein [Streptomyces tubercidicus]WAU12284.1 hypothetical protein STRTU_002606 [Streptomyces tubercidicus]GFE37688.1 hypothetical protein Stube_23610 [Streptomyces tubercidicus]